MTNGDLFSPNELATLWHPPTASVIVDRLVSAAVTELEPPANLVASPSPGALTLGRVKYRDDARPVLLDLSARRRHLYVIGRTGVGKTTLLLNLILEAIAAGEGIGVIDPHGDLADAVVARLPAERRRDLIHLDATDPARVVAFNPLACPDPRLIDQVASGVVSSFKKRHDSWGPRLEDTLCCAVYAIIEQGGNLRSVLRLLGEDAFRARTVAQLRDPVIRAFWIDEFGRWNPAVPHGGRRVHSK